MSLFNGAEFISPPECMDISIEKLLRFLEHIDSSGCTTTDRCGLHVNMSADNKTLDGVNLATFITLINQRLLFKLWGCRMKNHQYVKNMQNILKARKYDITTIYDLKSGINKKTDDIGHILLEDRYNFVNRRTMNGKTYIEIRVIGGENYHKKTKKIIQTIEHFAKAIEQAKTPQQLHKKTCKKMISYVNRTTFSNNEDVFMPELNSYNLETEKVFASELNQLENIHKYSIEDLMRVLQRRGVMPSIVSINRETVHINNLWKFFNSCIDYMYSAVIISGGNKKRKIYINYMNYHYIKYIYNVFGKKRCIHSILNKKLKESYGLHLPKNEPKRNLLWILKLIKGLPSSYREEFISTLPITVINYILKKKIPGIIMLAKSRKKFLTMEEIKEGC
jgi:hypothetical protein